MPASQNFFTMLRIMVAHSPGGTKGTRAHNVRSYTPSCGLLHLRYCSHIALLSSSIFGGLAANLTARYAGADEFLFYPRRPAGVRP